MMRTGHNTRRRLLVAIACLLPCILHPQPSTEAPQAFNLWIEQPAVVIDAEQKKESRSSPTPLNNYDIETTRLKPAAELTLRGSVYHPNFIELYLHGLAGLDSEDVKSSLGDEYNSSSQSFLQDYNANILFLREKPVATQVFAERTTFRREYDFFSTVQVDAQRYGINSGYSAGPFPFGVSAAHLEETTDDAFRPSTLTEDTAGFNIRNRRSADNATDLNYQYRSYDRLEDNLFSQSGVENSAQINDTEVFGPRDRYKLNSNLSGYDLDSGGGESTLASFQEFFANKHRDNLESTYRYGFTHNEREYGQSENHGAAIGLRHQLYSSLTSTIGAHGEKSSDSDEEDTLDKTVYGVSLGENYAKRLSTWGRLTAGYNVVMDQQQWDASGTGVRIIGEPHNLSDGVVTLLNYPAAGLGGIRVTDSTGTRIYLPGIDYEALPRGNRVQIRRGLGGEIPNGGAVLVDYDSTGASSSKFRMLGDVTSARLDLFDGLLGVYGRYSRQRYSGDNAPIDQDYNSALLGLDSRWGFFLGGAEYESYDSSQSPYYAMRFYETFTFHPSADSLFSLDFRQTHLNFPDENQQEKLYTFIGQYQIRLTSHLSLNAEAGRQYDRGYGGDRDATTYRGGIDFAFGQFSLSSRYEVLEETYRDEEQDRRILHITARRVF